MDKMEGLEVVVGEGITLQEALVAEFLVKELLVAMALMEDVEAVAVEQVMVVRLQATMMILQEREEMERLALMA
jgi:hypothetical protein